MTTTTNTQAGLTAVAGSSRVGSVAYPSSFWFATAVADSCTTDTPVHADHKSTWPWPLEPS